MVNFYMLIGPAGCGKSTYAKSLCNDNTILISSDATRKELFGDENFQGDNNKVFLTMIQRARNALLDGQNVVWDATSMSRKRRIGILQSMPKGTVFHAIVVIATLDEIKKQNAQRDRTVDEEVIMKQIQSFQAPYFTEGFDTIQVIGNSHYTRSELVDNMVNCQHENPHHRDGSVWDHCRAMRAAHLYDIISGKYEWNENEKIIYDACTFHDCGKPFVKFYDEDHIAHYHGHDGFSAYAYMSLLVNTLYIPEEPHDKLKTAVVIGEHMHMHRPDFKLSKLEQRIGSELVELCERLRYYDATNA